MVLHYKKCFVLEYQTMKLILRILLAFITTVSLASADEWSFTRADFTFENDADVRTDRAYTQGGKLYVLMHREDVNDSWLQIPFMSAYNREQFISFAVAQQMFTPDDLKSSAAIPGQQPYAGWLYFQTTLSQSSEQHLDSLSLKLGVVGQHSYMENTQKFIHWLIGSPDPEGWGNQLGSKPGIQLDYMHKWRYLPDDFLDLESDVIPFVSGEFGNVAIEGSVGGQWRVGYNIPNDYGESPMDEYGENGILTKETLNYRHKDKWSYYFNFGVGASVVLYDYFLDGTTLNGEQLVQKYYGRAFGTYGGTVRYESFSMSYIRTHYSQLYTTQDGHTNYGSLQMVYHF